MVHNQCLNILNPNSVLYCIPLQIAFLDFKKYLTHVLSSAKNAKYLIYMCQNYLKYLLLTLYHTSF